MQFPAVFRETLKLAAKLEYNCLSSTIPDNHSTSKFKLNWTIYFKKIFQNLLSPKKNMELEIYTRFQPEKLNKASNKQGSI